MSSQNQDFADVACGAEHSFALSTTGELYSWGLGFKGQLGHGDFENKLRPTLVKNMSPSFLESGMDQANQNSSKRSKSRDKQGPTNQNKSMDLSDINNLSDDQQTGLPEHDDEILRQLNQMTQEIINEDKSNNLYLLQPKEKVEQVECGSIHTLLRTNLNRLFSCGNGATYALGHGSRETLRTFKQIQFFNGNEITQQQVTGVGIKTIACGLMHSGCVLTDGTVYQWGTCGDYQSIDHTQKNAREFLQKAICQYPTKVSFRGCQEQVAQQSSSGGLSARRKSTNEEGAPLIVDIKMGEQFTIALSQRGYVYTWGMNDKGQLGIGNECPAFEPVQVPQIGPTPKHTIKPVGKISCGLKHCLVMTKTC